MRRKDREVTDFKRITEIMRDCDCCRLGLADGNGVYIVPMNFGMIETDGKISLYFHSAVCGRKIDILRSQSRVSFEMDTGHRLVADSVSGQCSFLYQSVIGSANAVFVEDRAEKILALKLIMEHYGDKSVWDFSDEVLSKTAVIRLDVTELSCKAHV